MSELQRGRRTVRTRRDRSASAGTRAAGDCRVLFRTGSGSNPRGPQSHHNGAAQPLAQRHALRKRARADARMHDLHVAAAASHERQQALARALHDDLGQLIALAQLRLAELALTPLSPNASRLCAQLSALMTQASSSLRQTCFALVRPDDAELDVALAIARHCRQLEDSFGRQIVFRREGESPALPASTAAVVLRAARELLVNACKHAEAHCIEACLSCHAGELLIDVNDDGCGMSLVTQLAGSPGFGLSSIRAQLEAHGAHLSIASQPGGGTQCRLRLPLMSYPQPRHL